MKKTYIAPEVEITRFNTEEIMSASAISYGASDADAYGNIDDNAKQSISYSDLYDLN